ncbi:helix-turn-helix domain-containing protein [Nocardia cyriacigeorgica]|uniref:helix-turn-helix domain-containing protein n=2 Tax=Nocardia cyriacigeorgica TaxID=135487 RepID=UPI0018953E2F|nr:helix-turn-helix transcriptional regulator [Nocardia cyriacigeorgica]MBF6094531.1 helix-turn-helix transcriptional regulator [Nocardia cyriacigeorgica]MBF6158779.1 helix-turn-helix transcriptional regulator [Nocardia cyriacigeorgica]MBF6197535.1 helix-turn-helix transcriptional regulator [Nocardia cyriacigeorgica]
MDLGERLQSIRKRCGLTQRELAESAQVSLSLVRKVEQGERDDVRIDTLRRLAVALGCPLTALLVPAPDIPDSGVADARWAPTRAALRLPAGDVAMPASGLEAVLAHATRLYHDNEYEQLARILPRLIQDGNGAPPLLRSRVHQLAGSVLVQTRQLEPARLALESAVTDAESTGNVLDAASAVVTLCWLLIVERRFDQVRQLSTEWADRIEPRLSAATTREISTWGWLLLRGSAAAVRDNRPDEAEDMMRLAAAGAVAIRPERSPYHQYWTTFDPATVAMKRVENAVIDDRPDFALRLARDIPRDLRPTSDNRNRHLLDIAAAQVDLRRYDRAVDVLAKLSDEARPWFVEQRLAREILSRIVTKRRTLTPQMRELARVVRLEY